MSETIFFLFFFKQNLRGILGQKDVVKGRSSLEKAMLCSIEEL